MGAVEEAGAADHQRDDAAVEAGASRFRAELAPDDGELAQRCHDPVAERGGADEPEGGHDDQHQRVDGGEAVPAEGHDQEVGVVVAELLGHRIGRAG